MADENSFQRPLQYGAGKQAITSTSFPQGVAADLLVGKLWKSANPAPPCHPGPWIQNGWTV